MKKKMIKVGTQALQLGMWLVPALAFAQSSNTPSVKISTVGGLIGILCTIFGWMFYILIVISLIMIILAAFDYVTAGDNSEKVSTARKKIMYAAIGLVVALLAKGLPLIVGNVLNVTNVSTLSAC
jgi:type IV secretion system pilin